MTRSATYKDYPEFWKEKCLEYSRYMAYNMPDRDEAITYFADPYAKFGLSFSFYENGDVHALDDIEPEKKVSGETAQIISFDSFRKKQ